MHFALLIVLSQLDGFSMWTDRHGVVHVVGAAQAPANATLVEGSGYSVIDADGRPAILADGGTRADDAAWWRHRFQQARSAVVESKALEAAAHNELRESQRELCVTATARSKAQVAVFSPHPSLVVVTSNQGTRTVQAGPATAVLVEDRDEVTAHQCQRGSPTSGQEATVSTRRAEREQAERALRVLEQEALAQRVPLRAWY